MNDYTQLINVINQNIKKNGVNSITGEIMNSVLKLITDYNKVNFDNLTNIVQVISDSEMKNVIGSINPSTVTTNLPNGTYFAQIAGTYTNASNIVVKTGFYTLLTRVSGNVWTLASETAMQLSNGVVAQNNTGAVNGGAVWAQLQGEVGPNETRAVNGTKVWDRMQGDANLGDNRAVNGDKLINYVQRATIALFDSNYSTNMGYLLNAKVLYRNSSTNEYSIYESLINKNKTIPSNDGVNWKITYLAVQKLKLTELTDVNATAIPINQFLVGEIGNKTAFRGITFSDVSVNNNEVLGEFVPTYSKGSNTWQKGTEITTETSVNTVVKRNDIGQIEVEPATSNEHAINLHQLNSSINKVKSPDGTTWQISVSNNGVLSTTKL